jgi:hypothetical protein
MIEDGELLTEFSPGSQAGAWEPIARKLCFPSIAVQP